MWSDSREGCFPSVTGRSGRLWSADQECRLSLGSIGPIGVLDSDPVLTATVSLAMRLCVYEDDWTKLPGRLIVLSGPSGSGKSTLVQRLLERPGLRLEVSISATTRPPRAGERSGRDYVFLSAPEFENIRDQLLESAEVHGHSYGTPAEPVRKALGQGTCVILVIEIGRAHV